MMCGSLMDINVYCVASLVGLFGEPASVRYRANMHRDIDTSGILTLGYDGFSAVSIAAKDCKAPCFSQIQGTKGLIVQHSAANSCEGVTLTGNGGESVSFREEVPHRLRDVGGEKGLLHLGLAHDQHQDGYGGAGNEAGGAAGDQGQAAMGLMRISRASSVCRKASISRCSSGSASVSRRISPFRHRSNTGSAALFKMGSTRASTTL